MARHTSSRKAARSAKRTRSIAPQILLLAAPLYRRPLRLEPLEDRRLLARGDGHDAGRHASISTTA